MLTRRGHPMTHPTLCCISSVGASAAGLSLAWARYGSSKHSAAEGLAEAVP